MVNSAVGAAVFSAWHDIKHTIVFTVLERCVNANMVSVGGQRLSDFLFIKFCNF